MIGKTIGSRRRTQGVGNPKESKGVGLDIRARSGLVYVEMGDGYVAVGERSHESCVLCGRRTAKVLSDVPMIVSCEVCGEFSMDFRLAVDRDMQGHRLHPYLSAATRKACARSGRPLTLNHDNWRELEEEQRSIRVAQKLNDLLLLVAERAGAPGGGWSP
jgi:hypothetical protein